MPVGGFLLPGGRVIPNDLRKCSSLFGDLHRVVQALGGTDCVLVDFIMDEDADTFGATRALIRQQSALGKADVFYRPFLEQIA